MTGKELVKLLKKNGWRVVRISGSHHLMQKDDKTVPIPLHGKKDLGKGLLNAILRQTGLK
ncbi:MAG: type II toxin-antitoxin system HicA family toxin [Spirochaetales bacterium]|nr:type II toxin-antitoxin system HicA family toxin [Spirochaetales bacterium]